MILKKPTSILSVPSTLHNLSFHASQSSTSPCPRRLHVSSSPSPRQYPQQQQQQQQQQQRRSYAQPANNSVPPSDDAADAVLSWPTAQPPGAVPTPYQILAHTRSTPYSKRRYYELVKLYHPDRCASAHDGHLHASIGALSPQTRLERYRLIVSAHEILSDPVKRKAYDAWGAGWGGTPDIRTGPYGRSYGGGNEESGDAGPFRNATWEDWERWRERSSSSSDGSNGDSSQAPVYISNLAFAAVILMLAALGGVGQATRAEISSSNFLEQRDLMHDQTSKDLMRIRRESRGLTREQRIQAFIRSRDAAMGPAAAAQEEQVRRLLPDMQFCSSEDLARRPPEFWSRNGRSGA